MIISRKVWPVLRGLSLVRSDPALLPRLSLPAAYHPRTIHSSTAMAAGFKQNRGTGDKGKSSLFNNERRVCSSHAKEARHAELADVVQVLTRVQCCLQDVGAHVATPPESSDRKKKLTSFDIAMVEWINAEIDRFGDQLPPIRQFILSGGGVTSSSLQHARAVARRAERTMIPLVRDEQIDPQALKFVNRLSDLLFVLGRYSCMRCGEEELTYLRPREFVEQKWNRKRLDTSK